MLGPLKPRFNGLIMTILGTMLCMVFLNTPVKYGGMLLLLAESLLFPPLLPRPDSNGQPEARIKLRLLSVNRNRNLLTGLNGAGRTLRLVMQWC